MTTTSDHQIDWDLLSTNLSSASLQALQIHLLGGQSNEEGTNNLEPGAIREVNSNTVFKDREYWEKRFEDEETYDWLVNFQDVSSQVVSKIRLDDRILIVGCGNSTFSNDIYDAGFKNITNIDFSDVVIRKMASLNAHIRPKMEWICMDMLELTFPDDSFDVVIDKAAMDAIMVDEGDVWNPKHSVIQDADKMCLGISRVLKPDGKFVQISFAQPHFRTKYLIANHFLEIEMDPYRYYTGYSDRYNWELSYSTIAREQGCLDFFIYSMEKHNK